MRDSLKILALFVLNNHEKIGFNIDIDEIINFNSLKIKHFLLKNLDCITILVIRKISQIMNNPTKINILKTFCLNFKFKNSNG